MKITILKYISFLLIFVSCTSHKTISNHWSKYIESNFSSNNLSASRNTVFEEPKLKLTKPLLSFQDSVKILTKSGTTYEGIITKSDFNGYYIKINNNNEIYVSNNEVKDFF